MRKKIQTRIYISPWRRTIPACIWKWDHQGAESVRQLQSGIEICKVFWEAQILRMHILQETRCCSIAFLIIANCCYYGAPLVTEKLVETCWWMFLFSMKDDVFRSSTAFSTAKLGTEPVVNSGWNLLKPMYHFKLNIHKAPQVTSWMRFPHSWQVEASINQIVDVPNSTVLPCKGQKWRQGGPTCSDQWNDECF